MGPAPDPRTVLTERQREEKTYFSRERWPFKSWKIDESIIPWNLRAFDRVLLESVGGREALEGKHVLDCGCGWGILSVLLAQRGARVAAVDLSPECVEIASRLARENEVEERVDARVGVLEKLEFGDESFDILVGTRILHHVDIETSARELFRVLRHPGTAVFWECTDRNRPYRFLRRLWRSVPLVPISGTRNEHPLTREELDKLDRTFGGTLATHPAPSSFFSHLATVLTRGKLPFAERVAGAVDRSLNRAFPALEAHGLHQILVLKKS
ncbi:MAG: methyltransferase domain-containing protein [bacterium]